MDIRDIARLSGYSLGTVSRVLNGHPNVSERARERVLSVVEEVGYEPNSNARYLKMQSHLSIAVFVKGSRNMLFADILERVQALLREAEEQPDVVYLGEDDNEVEAALRYERLRHPKGIVFLGGDPAYFKAAFSHISVPAVLVTNTAAGLGFKNLSSVSTNDVAAARELMEYLYGAGHRRIGIIGGERSLSQVGAGACMVPRRRCARMGSSSITSGISSRATSPWRRATTQRYASSCARQISPPSSPSAMPSRSGLCARCSTWGCASLRTSPSRVSTALRPGSSAYRASRRSGRTRACWHRGASRRSSRRSPVRNSPCGRWSRISCSIARACERSNKNLAESHKRGGVFVAARDRWVESGSPVSPGVPH